MTPIKTINEGLTPEDFAKTMGAYGSFVARDEHRVEVPHG